MRYVKQPTEDWTEEKRKAAIRSRESICVQINLLKYKLFAAIEGCLSVAGVHVNRHQYKQAHEEVIVAIAKLIEAGEHLEQLADTFDRFKDDFTYEPPLVLLGQGEYARPIWEDAG